MDKLPRPRAAALLFLACLCSALHVAPAKPETGEIITLPRFEVKGNPICCYGFGIIATWDAKPRS